MASSELELDSEHVSSNVFHTISLNLITNITNTTLIYSTNIYPLQDASYRNGRIHESGSSGLLSAAAASMGGLAAATVRRSSFQGNDINEPR